MIEVLEHTDRDSQVLKECFRVLKPGGFLVLFVPNKLYPFESHPCHIGDFPLAPTFRYLVASGLNPQTSLRRSSLFAPQTHFDSPPSRISEPGTGYMFPPLIPSGCHGRKPIDRIALWLEKSALAQFGVSITRLPKAAPPDKKLAIGTSVIPSPARFLRNHRGTGPCGSDTRGGGQNGAMDPRATWGALDRRHQHAWNG